MTPSRTISLAVNKLLKAEEFLTRQHEIHADKLTTSEMEYVRAIPSMVSFLEAAANSHWHRTTNVPDWHGQSTWQDIALRLARTILEGDEVDLDD